MATTTTAPSTVNGAFSLLAAPFVAIGNWMIRLAESNTQVRKAQFLYSLSDEDLAKRGLKREDIVTHVFGNFHGV